MGHSRHGAQPQPFTSTAPEYASWAMAASFALGLWSEALARLRLTVHVGVVTMPASCWSPIGRMPDSRLAPNKRDLADM